MAATYQGGLAQYANANFQDVYEMPAGMPMEVAAGFPGVFGTSYHALKQRARLKPGETLLVLGAAGGVGLAAVQIGAAMGARVIAAARGEQKINFLRDNGADELIDYGTDNLKDAVKDLTGGKGADVIYDPVGGDLFDQATRCITGTDGSWWLVSPAAGFRNCRPTWPCSKVHPSSVFFTADSIRCSLRIRQQIWRNCLLCIQRGN